MEMCRSWKVVMRLWPHHWVLMHQYVDPIAAALQLQQLPLRSHMHFCVQTGHIGEQPGQAPIFHLVHCPQDQWQLTMDDAPRRVRALVMSDDKAHFCDTKCCMRTYNIPS